MMNNTQDLLSKTRLNSTKASTPGQLTGSRVIFNQMDSRRLHVENDMSSGPWKKMGEKSIPRKIHMTKGFGVKTASSVVVKLDGQRKGTWKER